METPLVLEGENNMAHLGWSIGMGMIYVIAAVLPVAIIDSIYFLSPMAIAEFFLTNGTIYSHTAWTDYAFYSMSYGSLALFGTMSILWLIAYIPNETIQGIYIEAIPIATWISYGLAAWVITALILGVYLNDDFWVAGVSPDSIGWNIGYGLIFSGCMIGLEIMVEFLFLPEACNYYEGNMCDRVEDPSIDI